MTKEEASDLNNLIERVLVTSKQFFVAELELKQASRNLDSYIRSLQMSKSTLDNGQQAR